MKNSILYIVFFVLYSSGMYAQVGINTDNPRSVLDVQNVTGQQLGLTIPTVANTEATTTTDGSAIPNGTIVYDTSRDALCIKLSKGYNCITQGGNSYITNYTKATQEAYIKASNTGEADNFGYAIALSADGNTLAVGAYLEASSATGVNVDHDNNEKLNSGAVYVFSRTGAIWTQQAYVKASNTGENDFFGSSVALSADGNTLAVGANREDSNATGVNNNQIDNQTENSGAVYVFGRTGANWTQQAYVKASNTGENDNFGFVIALSADGNTLAVGAYNEDSSATGVNKNQSDNSASQAGAVYVFSRAGTTWTQQAYVKASNAEQSDFFGYSVALSADGNTLAVGAYLEASSATGVNKNQQDNSAPYSGAVYVFSRTGATWTQQAYVKASNTGKEDQFGYSVALSPDGNTLAVGADYEASNAMGVGNSGEADNSAPYAGAVYVFSRVGTSWTQQAYVKASNTEEDDQFGYSVALSADGNTLAVGAYNEDSKATGVNENQLDNSTVGAGAVYVFSRTGATWTQQAYVKASNPGEEDNFGNSIALGADGNTLAVGAYGEDSKATGVNKDQSDNSTFYSGAVYVFEAP